MAQAAALAVSAPVLFEISVMNADKGSLDAGQIATRLRQFTPEMGFARVVLTREALLADKAAVLPGNDFVVGYDTAARVVDPKYYDGELGLRMALDRLRELRCRLVVAGRVADSGEGRGAFLTLDSLPIPEGFDDLFVGLSEEAFRVDLSSSQIRAAAAALS
jgi:hypothetical protein